MKDHLTVKEFALLTNRSTNQIYDLAKKGNKYRKLRTYRSVSIGSKLMVRSDEAVNFPFTAADKVRIDFTARVERLEKRMTAMSKASSYDTDQLRERINELEIVFAKQALTNLRNY